MISETALRLALEEVDNAILASLPEPSACSHQFSAKFERKIRAVIRHGNHPALYKSLQRVACLFLVLLMLFGSMIAFSANVRATVIGWIKEQYQTFYHYFFPSVEITVDLAEYALGWVPDGYALINTQTTELRMTQIYFGPSNQMLQFTCQRGTNASYAFFDTEAFTQHAVTIGSIRAEIYISTSKEATNSIVWSDPDSGVLFSISAPLTESELIKIAENITKQ